MEMVEIVMNPVRQRIFQYFLLHETGTVKELRKALPDVPSASLYRHVKILTDKKKLSALWYLAGKIEDDRQYTESEINTVLDEWTLFHDPATLRRELYNKRLLDRTADCRGYRKADNIPAFEEFIKHYV